MRRALIALLAVTPVFAAAQTPADGAIASTTTTVNMAQCTGVSDPVIGLNDDMNVELTWTVKPNAAGTTVSSGIFRLYASSVLPAAGQNGGTSCTTNSNGDSISASQGTVIPAGNSGSTDIIATAATTSRSWAYKVKDIASAAKMSCARDDSEQPIYLCVQWIQSGAASGFATATLTLDRKAPSPPNNVRSSPGDGKLHISCDSTDDVVGTYRAVATGGTGGVKRSNVNGSCRDLEISGLTNDTPYSVVVYKMNAANNPSGPSDPALSDTSTIPIPTDDFWDEYQRQNGAEQGGCNTGAGAAGVLAALSLIAAAAAARRRKP